MTADDTVVPLTEDEVALALGRLYLVLLRIQKERDALRARLEEVTREQ